MMIKVCGMRAADNIKEIAALQPDYLGFIFYEKSQRYCKPEALAASFDALESISPKRVGVFVNATEEEILYIARRLSLAVIQLHGEESVALVESLKRKGLAVWKAFGVSEQLPIEEMSPFDKKVDAFLLDTKTSGYGGSGQQFNWQSLEEYPFESPFILSGGISEADAEAIQNLKLPQLLGVDINSRFEVEPAVKDPEKVKQFIQKLRNITTHEHS